MKNHHRFKLFLRIFLGGGAVLLSLLLLTFLWTSKSIGSNVKSITGQAMAVNGGDRVEALIRFVEDSNHSFKERNRAVWALGQLGDRQALPVLRKYYTGLPCDHAHALCQRELEKAIGLIDSGFNVTAIIWRR